MTNPITPPPELVEEWWGDVPSGTSLSRLATQAAQWGADQELEACCTWLSDHGYIAADPELRAARRPKPPSLKEQALDAWDRLRNEAWCEEIDFDLDFVRRALEALDD